MNTDIIFRLLENSGFHNIRMDSGFLYVEDPSCILRSFDTFVEYAWFAIALLTGTLLFGWAISLIRGAKYDNMLINIRNLILIFGGLTLAKPVINMIYGNDLFARGCRTIAVPMTEVNKLLDARSKRLKDNDKFYEILDIQDSGPNIIDASVAESFEK